MGYIPPQGVGVAWSRVKAKLEDNVTRHLQIAMLQLSTITRDKLEYPTEDVSFAYLTAIDKIKIVPKNVIEEFILATDVFTDKGVGMMVHRVVNLMGRFIDAGNFYMCTIYIGLTTQDFLIYKKVGGIDTTLGYEAVDLANEVFDGKFTISGSSLVGYRVDLTTPKISVTDTEFTSGRYGSGPQAAGHGIRDHHPLRLIAPSSSSPPALAVIEVPVEKVDVEKVETQQPLFSKDLREISGLTELPDFLQKEAKRYEMLKAKGFTDEEIELLLGYMPQHQVDLQAVSWGAFDYKGEATMLCCITADNPYQSGAILGQTTYAESKNLKIYKPPTNLAEARELHKAIKVDRPDIIAGVHNLAYQLIGDANLEPLAVADFYDGFVQGWYDWKDLEAVPQWELERTIKRWIERLEKADVPVEEKEKHLEKLKQILKS